MAMLGRAANAAIKPLLDRVNARSIWWQFGLFPILSRVSVSELWVGGRRVKVHIPAHERERQQWEINHLFLDDPYCLRSLNSGQVSKIIDVGANIGFFSILARHYFPEATIDAYEPSESVFPLLTKNLSGLDVNIFPTGVGRNAGRGVVVERETSLFNKIILSNCGRIPIVSISQAITRIGGVVDLCKLDCEGAEWEILDDSGFLDRVRYLAMEYHPDPNGHRDIEWLIRRLRGAGFSIQSLRESDVSGVGQVFAKKSARFGE
jgi:FkbM family methyltransferase